MNKKMRVSFFLLGILLFLVNGDNYAAAPLLIDLARDLSINIQTAAFSVTSYMLFFGIFTLFFGPLGDRFGKTRIIKIAALGTAIFSILGALARSLVFLICVRAFNGLFAAGIMPVAIAFAGQSVKPENRQNMIGKLMGMMFLGGAMATLIGGLLTYFGSWRIVYGFYGVSELIIGLILLVVLPLQPQVAGGESIWRSYGIALKNKSLVKIISIMFLLGFAVLGTFAFSGKLVEESTGLNILLVGLILSSYGVGTLLGGRLAGALRAKLGNKFFSLAGIIGCLALILIYSIQEIYSLIPAFFLFGLSFILLQSSFVTQAQMTNPTISGTIMSLASFMMVSSGALGTIVNRFIITRFNLHTIYIVAACSLLLISLIVPFALKPKTEQPEQV